MANIFRTANRWLRSDNRKSKIQNIMVGLVALAVAFALCGVALCAMLFVLCLPAEAQQPKKVPRLGYLSSSNPASESTRFEAIRLALRERGYIEGQNIASEYRYTEGKGRDQELAAELVRLKVDIIVAAGGHR